MGVEKSVTVRALDSWRRLLRVHSIRPATSFLLGSSCTVPFQFVGATADGDPPGSTVAGDGFPRCVLDTATGQRDFEEVLEAFPRATERAATLQKFSVEDLLW